VHGTTVSTHLQFYRCKWYIDRQWTWREARQAPGHKFQGSVIRPGTKNLCKSWHTLWMFEELLRINYIHFFLSIWLLNGIMMVFIMALPFYIVSIVGPVYFPIGSHPTGLFFENLHLWVSWLVMQCNSQNLPLFGKCLHFLLLLPCAEDLADHISAPIVWPLRSMWELVSWAKDFWTYQQAEILCKFEPFAELDEFVNCVCGWVKPLQEHSLLPCSRHSKFGDIQLLVLG